VCFQKIEGHIQTRQNENQYKNAGPQAPLFTRYSQPFTKDGKPFELGFNGGPISTQDIQSNGNGVGNANRESPRITASEAQATDLWMTEDLQPESGLETQFPKLRKWAPEFFCNWYLCDLSIE